MARPRINLMIMTQGETDSPVRSYSLPWYAPRGAIIAGVTVLVLLIVTSALSIYHYNRSRKLDEVQAELESARSLAAKMDALQQELIYHREFTRRVAGLLGISVPSFADSVQKAASATGGVGAAAILDSLTPGLAMEHDGLLSGPGVLVSDCPPDPNNRPRGLPLMGRISRGFAPHQNNPSMRHSGVDFAVREGTPVLVTADGVIEFSGEHDVYGLLITVDHGNGFKTSYGHNSLLLSKVGETVKRGERIAVSGNTGVSTAPHLHYEIVQDGQPVDPSGFLGG